jgi:Arc/MetJ-type ribon-helix-helix transcriptional regulator
MRKEYTTISIQRELFDELEKITSESPFYASVGEYVRRAIGKMLREGDRSLEELIQEAKRRGLI